MTTDLRIPVGAAGSTQCGLAFARPFQFFVAGKNLVFCQTKPFDPRCQPDCVAPTYPAVIRDRHTQQASGAPQALGTSQAI
jgi:hypothetical protein